MTRKVAICPHCKGENLYNEQSFIDVMKHDLPGHLLLSMGSIFIKAKSRKFALLKETDLLYSDYRKYRDGKTVTCDNCGQEFKV
jgi:hypothetical protein